MKRTGRFNVRSGLVGGGTLVVLLSPNTLGFGLRWRFLEGCSERALRSPRDLGNGLSGGVGIHKRMRFSRNGTEEISAIFDW